MNAVAYIRISQLDQSNFSIDGQQSILKKFAKDQGLNIVDTFIDNGKSARNFNRPEWKKLIASLKGHKAKYILVAKYNRLIRNAAEGLAFLEQIESKFGIRVLSATEHISIDPASPFFFKMRADMLVTAEFERRVISDQSKFGTWQAKNSGRFIGQAPFGYKNARDKNNKPIIVVVPERAEIIKSIYEKFISGFELDQCRKFAVQSGMHLKGHDAIKRILTNPVYAGLIPVPSYGKNAATTIKGLHQALISESWHYICKEKIDGRSKQPKSMEAPSELPLRGSLTCACGKRLTGGFVKSEQKRPYGYYICLDCKLFISGKKTNQKFLELFHLIKFPKELINAIIVETKKKVIDKVAEKKASKAIIEKDIENLEIKVNSIEEKYIENKIEESTYRKWKNIYSRDLAGKKLELDKIKILDDKIATTFVDNANLFNQIDSVYEKASPIVKQQLLNLFFGDKIIVEKHSIELFYLHPILSYNYLHIKELDFIKMPTSQFNSVNFPICTPNGFVVEHFYKSIPLLNVKKYTA
jgi:DNA invertase Pin-like site-specific DNA recombinase